MIFILKFEISVTADVLLLSWFLFQQGLGFKVENRFH